MRVCIVYCQIPVDLRLHWLTRKRMLWRPQQSSNELSGEVLRGQSNELKTALIILLQQEQYPRCPVIGSALSLPTV